MNIKINTLTDKKEQLNATMNAKAFKELVGKEIVIDGILLYTKEETDNFSGEVKETRIGVVKVADDFYATNSSTICDNLESLHTFLGNECIGTKATVDKQNSKRGREFLVLKLK